MKNLKGLDTRQIPKTREICSNKNYHDILYSFLQEHSKWDGVQGHRRYVEASFINYSEIGRLLKLSRQTVAKKFNNLIELNLVEPLNQDGKYELNILPVEIASLIPESTLKLIIDTLSEHCMSTYIYLLLRYYANNEKPFTFSLKEVKQYIGISVKTRSNDSVITNILYVLQKIGLIKYSLTTQTQGSEEFQDIKTIYQLDYLTNYIEI